MRLPTAIPAVAATLTVVAPEAVLPVVVVLFALKNALTSEPTVVTSVLADLHQATFKLLPHAPGVLAAHEPRPEASPPLYGPVSYTHLTLPTILLV